MNVQILIHGHPKLFLPPTQNLKKENLKIVLTVHALSKTKFFEIDKKQQRTSSSMTLLP